MAIVHNLDGMKRLAKWFLEVVAYSRIVTITIISSLRLFVIILHATTNFNFAIQNVRPAIATTVRVLKV